jgi:DNA polymerase-3 subunit gamma/tau
MVCKNPPTIHLLEVGDGTKKKYYEQSQKTDMAFLLKGIEMANDCDLKYKTSRNQRLLVELCLMQLASITFYGEKKNDSRYLIPPSHYKVNRAAVAPKQAVEPKVITEIPSAIPVEATPIVAPSTNVSLETAALSESSSTIEEAQQAVITETPRLETPTPEVQTPGVPTTVTTKTEAPKINITTERVSGLSIKGLHKKRELEQQRAAKKLDVTNLPKEPFTEIAMQAAWQEYVERITVAGEKILASNMEADTPTLEGTTIHLEFPNETMKVEVERAQGPLLEFLKRKLSNYDIVLEIKVNEEVQRKYAYTPQEKYDKLREQNPELDILRQTFDLQL